ncbi:SDR family NAD(P)-dependent oxidoreductase [Saccharothrix deserti]|uniref:SDR family NAD(P)-dependent oxidoreductase n=1 Tax=Saccharothrix deserti TaxID=2593674 RepID=UPI00131EB503|nr:SDR family NAD(P)-dependent oxidoreductase [Saccharothrix deserti]
MDLGITGRVALVHGAGGGLGGAAAQRLAAEGAVIAVADVRGEAAEVTADRIRGAGGRALALEWDLGDLSVIDANATRIEDVLGPVDILVNNTGGPPPTPVLGNGPDTWTDHFRSMVLSVIAIADRVVPGMCDRGWGRVVTSTSSGVVAPIADLGLSNSVRTALVGWSKTLAREVGGAGVTCNIVVPGRIGTARVRALDESKAAREKRSVGEVADASIASIPVGRYGDPAEYAAVVAFLQQTGVGLAVRKYVMRRRGLLAHDAQRSPGALPQRGRARRGRPAAGAARPARPADEALLTLRPSRYAPGRVR